MTKLTVTKKENKPIIELVNLVKQFGDKTVLKDLNMSINKGEFITILGASGSGKTTALRLIGGFEWPTRGEIKFYGVDVKDLPAYKRPTNTIFQDYALFPHLTVSGNIKYGLKLIRVQKEKISESTIKKFNLNIAKWNKKAEMKMAKLDKDQEEYANTLSKNKISSYKYRKARKWLDNSDFHYSYWETFVSQKKELFEKMFTTRSLNKKEINQKVKNIIKLIGLEENETKTIDQLSGGMKQRVALARALVTRPQVLLLDEPLSALDLKVRQKMQRELKAIQKELNLTFIFVTHDQEEAMTISDKIAVMRAGKIEQFDKPKQIYEFPANSWVANFIGESNIFEAEVVRKNKLKAFNIQIPGDTYDFKKGAKVKVMLRPEDITISSKSKGFLSGEIATRTYQGTFWEYAIKIKSKIWKVKTTKEYQIGNNVNLRWTSYDIHSMEE